MKKEIKISLFLALNLVFASLSFALSPRGDSSLLLAQLEEDMGEDEDFFDEADEEEARKAKARKLAEEERKRKLAEEEAERVSIEKRALRDRKLKEAQLKEADAVREAQADSTEYTISPGSVEMVVELDPNNYGFRQRNHRMTMGAEFDFILRGRGMLQYDYRFFEYLSVALNAGIDWNDLAVYNRFSALVAKQSLRQFSVLAGLSAKWRVTEWYMRSAIFIEPSLIGGRLWQSFANQESAHWRLRPGLFVGTQSVFDSGFVLSFRLGAEFPLDFGPKNPRTEAVEPLATLGFGLAI